jgi:hypothetical protein
MIDPGTLVVLGVLAAGAAYYYHQRNAATPVPPPGAPPAAQIPSTASHLINMGPQDPVRQAPPAPIPHPLAPPPDLPQPVALVLTGPQNDSDLLAPAGMSVNDVLTELRNNLPPGFIVFTPSLVATDVSYVDPVSGQTILVDHWRATFTNGPSQLSSMAQGIVLIGGAVALSPANIAALNAIVTYMHANPTAAAPVPTPVANWLIEHGIDAGRITYKWPGVAGDIIRIS